MIIVIIVSKCLAAAPNSSLVCGGRCPGEMTAKMRANGPIRIRQEEEFI